MVFHDSRKIKKNLLEDENNAVKQTRRKLMPDW